MLVSLYKNISATFNRLSEKLHKRAHPHDPSMAVAWENLCGHLVTRPLLLADLPVSVTCVAQGSYI